jgi:hypothetical protein
VNTKRFGTKAWLVIDYNGNQGGVSQNILGKFVRFFKNLGLQILRLFRLKGSFEADIIKR